MKHCLRFSSWMSLNTQVDRVVSWCQENDVLINAKKSVVLFNSPDEVATVRIGETEVSPSASGKYLGFRFKSSKKYGQLLVDLKDVAIDIKRRTHLLRRVSFKLNSRELMMFGKALVMGKLNYYLPLLTAERSTGTLRCLDVALNDFMRVMTGLIKTTPVPLLHYFSGIPTLDILIRESSMRNFKRINLNSDCLIDQEYREWDGSNLGASPYFLDLDLDGSLLNACLQRAGRTKLHQHTSAFRSTHPVPTHLRRLLLALPALQSDRRPPTAPSSSDSPAARGYSCRTPIVVFDLDGPTPLLEDTPSARAGRTPDATCFRELRS